MMRREAKNIKPDRAGLAERIRSERILKGMTQTELAARAGIDRMTLVAIESQWRSPRLETLAKVMRALGWDRRQIGAEIL